MNCITSILKRIIKAPTFATFVVFASVSMFSTLVSGISGILQARWVGPEIFGQFQKYSILTTYLVICLVFVQDGLSRQYPYLIGQGKRAEALAVAAVAKTWYVGSMLLFCVILLVLSIRALLNGAYYAAIGWGAQIPVAVAMSYGIFLQTLYRRSLEFKQLSYNGLVASIIGFLSLYFVKIWGFVGLALKVDFLNISRVYLDARHVPIRVKMAWDFKTFCDLVKISVPLSLEGYIRTSFFTATFAYLVVTYCSTRDLGLYGVAAAFEGIGLVFVNALIQIFDVKMANKYGETESISSSVHSLLLPTIFGVICSIILALALCIVIGPFIRYFVPKYKDAISILYVMSFAMPVSILMMPTRLLRIALKYKSIFTMTIFRIIALIIFIYLVPNNIEWFAGCKIAADLVSIILGYYLIYRLTHKASQEGKCL